MMDVIVTYEIALKLKEFNYSTKGLAHYNIFNKEIFFHKPKVHSEAIFAPTYNEVVEWFKSVHNIEAKPTEESILDCFNKI